MSIGRTEFTSGLRVVAQPMARGPAGKRGGWVRAGARAQPPPH